MRLRRLLTPACCLALCACSSPTNMLAPGGPAAAGIARLGTFALILFSAVTIAVWLLLGVITMRRRGSFSEHAPVEEAPVGQGWLMIFGFAIPAGVLALLFVLMLSTMKRFPIAPAHAMDAPAAIRVTGRQWWFDAEYLGNAPNEAVHVAGELHVPVGQPVDVQLQTRDVIHSFWIPRLHGKVDLVPGFVNHVRLQADQPGVYEGRCAEFCGVQHAHMLLRVFADRPDAFEAWVAHQRKPASEPQDGFARHGRDVFMSAACPICHTIRGTPAQGAVGPDLTHLASRSRIAGESLSNDPANLEAWVVHAQSLKKGAQMPDLPQFRGDDLRALVAYLQGLD